MNTEMVWEPLASRVRPLPSRENPAQRITMCLAIPARIEELLAEDCAIVNLGGVRKEVSLVLLDDAAPGDYVIVHVGYALQKLDPAEAERTLEMFAELDASNEFPDELSGSAI
ncbi:MAG TPA: HypC/HybG/HupF family hydrogenase formation chaperone [Gallionella sp.]|nr:HypC/HybG/HupF family hydrogenase formation chaperone [Gallionella sp.]